jgi:hypothetical protein
MATKIALRKFRRKAGFDQNESRTGRTSRPYGASHAVTADGAIHMIPQDAMAACAAPAGKTRGKHFRDARATIESIDHCVRKALKSRSKTRKTPPTESIIPRRIVQLVSIDHIDGRSRAEMTIDASDRSTRHLFAFAIIPRSVRRDVRSPPPACRRSAACAGIRRNRRRSPAARRRRRRGR